jgi:hypothetical protein
VPARAFCFASGQATGLKKILAGFSIQSSHNPKVVKAIFTSKYKRGNEQRRISKKD